MMDKYIGRLLDNRYEILEMIGSGGMAVVYKARCHRLNRLVAIKILKDDFLEDEDFRRRFHAESQAVAMLSHPNIVSVYDVSTSISMEADYIVMELIEGITLKQYMEKKGVLNWKETLHFAMQIAKALEHAHSRGVVHRDIKPHNVMVLKNGSVKVADFGIARMMSKGDTLTKEALGSVHYISPEQAKGGRVDNRSDIYSLGVVMYEMMSGRPPYEGESPVSVAIAHINGGAVLPSALNPNIPGGMEQIIMKAMAHELDDRYATATQMLTDMEEFRKNPALVFPYPVGGKGMHKPSRLPLTLHTGGIKTTADRVEARSEAHKKQRSTELSAAKKTAAVRGEKESGFSIMATVAIVSLSLVCVIGLVIFLVYLLSGPGGTMVEVPDLRGEYLDSLQPIDGLVIKESRSVYNSEYAEGQIISHTPKAGVEVRYGTTVSVVVSKGAPKPTEMINLIGLTEQKARDDLESLSLETNVVVETEYNSLDAGKVIRTQPESGEIITAGQTVTIWISLGEAPEGVVIKPMPGLVGLTLDVAVNTLKAYDFPDPVFVKYYHDSPAGTVLRQSVSESTMIPVDTVIKLEVSLGPDPSQTEPEDTLPPETEPENSDPTETETDTTPETVDVMIDISQYISEEGITFEIRRDGVAVYSGTTNSENPFVTIAGQTGSGEVEYAIYINDVQVGTEKVSF